MTVRVTWEQNLIMSTTSLCLWPNTLTPFTWDTRRRGGGRERGEREGRERERGEEGGRGGKERCMGVQVHESVGLAIIYIKP